MCACSGLHLYVYAGGRVRRVNGYFSRRESDEEILLFRGSWDRQPRKRRRAGRTHCRADVKTSWPRRNDVSDVLAASSVVMTSPVEPLSRADLSQRATALEKRKKENKPHGRSGAPTVARLLRKKIVSLNEGPGRLLTCAGENP